MTQAPSSLIPQAAFYLLPFLVFTCKNRERSKSLGHVAIIDINTRRNMKLKEELRTEARRCELLHFERPEDRRYKERTNVERVYARLKDEFGGRMIQVRGYAKVLAHLMFGILALTADQLMRLVSQPVT